MELTKWVEKPEEVYGLPRIVFREVERVISISIEEGGEEIVFREECDGYFGIGMTKAEAKLALFEAIEWIDEMVSERGEDG